MLLRHRARLRGCDALGFGREYQRQAILPGHGLFPRRSDQDPGPPRFSAQRDSVSKSFDRRYQRLDGSERVGILSSPMPDAGRGAGEHGFSGGSGAREIRGDRRQVPSSRRIRRAAAMASWTVAPPALPATRWWRVRSFGTLRVQPMVRTRPGNLRSISKARRWSRRKFFPSARVSVPAKEARHGIILAFCGPAPHSATTCLALVRFRSR